ncbi:MAG: ABC transporter permease [Terriglobales bacterium]
MELAASPAAAAPVHVHRPTGLWLPAATLWWRELVRFYRQKARVVGVIGSPIIFWLIIGAGFGTSFSTGAAAAHGTPKQGYLAYFFPGTMVLIVLFTAIFTMMSVIDDRQEGFLQAVLVAPCPRASIVLGKALGGATLATLQGIVFLALAPTLGISVGFGQFWAMFGVLGLVALSLTGAGFIIAWRLDSSHAFHAIVNLFLIPAWLVSGALFPLAGASHWIRLVMLINPLTYGTEALRQVLYGASALPLTVSLAVIVGFDAVMLALALWMVTRERRAGV